MSKFFEDLRKMILLQDEHIKKKLIPYYETIIKIKDIDFKNIVSEYNNSSWMNYIEEDEEEYYSDGMIEFYINDTEYNIHLSSNNQYGNYCGCKPEDEGYNPLKRCCGIECDYYPPRVDVTKIKNVVSYTFDGYEREMWQLTDDWLNKSEKEQAEKKKNEQILHMESRIKEMQHELEILKNT